MGQRVRNITNRW